MGFKLKKFGGGFTPSFIGGQKIKNLLLGNGGQQPTVAPPPAVSPDGVVGQFNNLTPEQQAANLKAVAGKKMISDPGGGIDLSKSLGVGKVAGGGRFLSPERDNTDSQVRSLAGLFGEPNTNKDLFGPSQAAYDEALAVAQAAGARSDKLASERVLGEAQSRGILDSGITSENLVRDVLGPAQERDRTLAATFELEKARSASQFLQQMESKKQDQKNTIELSNLDAGHKKVLQGLINSGQLDLAAMTGSQREKLQVMIGKQAMEQLEREMALAEVYKSQDEKEERGRRRKSGIAGLLGGIVGGIAGGPGGAAGGSDIGSKIGDLF